MTKLRQLIKQYGQPNALIDHWDSNSSRYAIWGFEEEFLIDNTGTAFVNGMPVNGSPINILQNILDQWMNGILGRTKLVNGYGLPAIV